MVAMIHSWGIQNHQTLENPWIFMFNICRIFHILAIINIRTILFSSAGTHVDPNDQDAIGFYRISIGNLSMPSLDIYEMMKHNASRITYYSCD
jgi:hypothetical protein